MKYINKCDVNLQGRGINETQRIIDLCWNADENRYVNLVYDHALMGNMERILIEAQRDGEEQHYGLCCYCMRRLFLEVEGEHKKNATLEHIIPNKIKREAWEKDGDKYRSFDCLTERYVKVCFGGNVQNDSERILKMPYPHFLSYHNMVLSCNGESVENGGIVLSNCCNNKRGDHFVLPMYLRESIGNEIYYTKEGDIDFDDDLFDAEWFSSRCLNLKSEWIRRVRRFWYLLSLSGYSVADVEEAIGNEELRNCILDDVDDDNNLANVFISNRHWALLSEYNWFYRYYKKTL